MQISNTIWADDSSTDHLSCMEINEPGKKRGYTLFQV
jgi:hypothetical protein